MHLSTYLGLLHAGERTLADSYRQVGEGHQVKADVFYACRTVAAQCDAHVEALAAVVERYGEAAEPEPERLHAVGLFSVRSGGWVCCATCTSSTRCARSSTSAERSWGRHPRDCTTVSCWASCRTAKARPACSCAGCPPG